MDLTSYIEISKIALEDVKRLMPHITEDKQRVQFIVDALESFYKIHKVAMSELDERYSIILSRYKNKLKVL